jgi:hypothetical protein
VKLVRWSGGRGLVSGDMNKSKGKFWYCCVMRFVAVFLIEVWCICYIQEFVENL